MLCMGPAVTADERRKLLFAHQFNFRPDSCRWRTYVRKQLHAEVHRGTSLFSQRHANLSGFKFTENDSFTNRILSPIMLQDLLTGWSEMWRRVGSVDFQSIPQIKCKCCSFNIIKWWNKGDTPDTDILTLSELCVIFDKQMMDYFW